MSALSQPKVDPRSARKRSTKTAKRRLRQPHARRNATFMTRATEATTILGVNVVLIGTCLYTLGNMLPHQLTQQAKLEEIKGEVHRTTEHVNQLKESHKRSLTPSASRRISEEQGYLIGKNKRNLVWLKPSQTQP